MDPEKLTETVPTVIRSTDFIIRQYGIEGIENIRAINSELFNEERVINHYHHSDLLVFTASVNDIIVGFKVGYGKSKGVYYSAKGGVLPTFRRNGIASRLLEHMMLEAWKRGYRTFGYDTFPNQHKGMLILGLNTGFRITGGGWNKMHHDYHLHLELDLAKQFK